MKKFKKSIACVLTIVFLFPTIYSCTTSNQDDLASNSEYREKAIELINAADLIAKRQIDNYSNRMIAGVEVTQELVDEYAVMLGYQVGDFSVEDIDEIIEKYGIATEQGIEQFLENYNLTEFTKLEIKYISEGNWIENLENQPNYLNLNLNEKELLSLVNAYAQELDSQGRLEGNFWGLYGAVIGAIVGSVLCVVCAIAGALIGGLIGSGVK